eukprot:scaffold2603_cov55-Phaeocystis_antarctica.AAC.2
MSNVDMWARAWHTCRCMGRLLFCLLFADLSHPITTHHDCARVGRGTAALSLAEAVGASDSHWLRQWALDSCTALE